MTHNDLETLIAVRENDILLWGSRYFRVEQAREPRFPEAGGRVLVGRWWSVDTQEWGDVDTRHVIPELQVQPIQILDDKQRAFCGFPRSDGRDWHMLDQLPSPGCVPGNLDPATEVYVLRREPYPVDQQTGNPLDGDFAQYGLYEAGERLPGGTVREHEREERTEWIYTSREGRTHDEIQAEVTEWAGRLFGRPVGAQHNGHGDWELEVGAAEPAAADAGTPAAVSGGAGASTYEDAVRQLVAAADRIASYIDDLAQFSDTLAAKGWGEEVIGLLDGLTTPLATIEARYRDLAASMLREGNAGAAAREAAPYVPEIQAL
ncbi:hypothetical protein [Actinophytocola sp.]|uniref:hypothetical protein n=1 Tax=Actinophytocola sp. TaxID=1872138 RepID=UPI002ED37689